MVEVVLSREKNHIVHFELLRIQRDMKLPLGPTAGQVIVIAIRGEFVERKTGPKEIGQHKDGSEAAHCALE